jgi:hypothetical protein
MKSFELAAAEANGAAEEKLPFKMAGDDTQLYAYPPSEGQLVLLLGLAGQDAGTLAAEVLGVFWEALDGDSAEHLRGRLRSRTDRFGLGDVMHIIEWLTEEATARPTTPPSDSTSSPGTTGTPSTEPPRQRASTRSPSPRTGSATSSTRGRSSASRTSRSSTPS